MSQGELGAIVRRRLRAGAAGAFAIGVLAIGLLLSGCSGPPPEPSDPPTTTADPTDDAEPTEEPTSEPDGEPTPDPTTTVEPPTWDPAMDEATLDGAFAFGEHFLHLYSYVIATGDTTEWRALSHPECGFCSDTATTAETSGFTSDSHRVDIARLAGEEVEPGHYYSLDYSVTEWADGTEMPAELVALVGVLREGDRWLMGAVEIREDEA